MSADEDRHDTPRQTTHACTGGAPPRPVELLHHLPRSAGGRWALPESLVTMIAEEIRRFHGGNEVLNRIEAEHLLTCAFDMLESEADSTANQPAGRRTTNARSSGRDEPRPTAGRHPATAASEMPGRTETDRRNTAGSRYAALPVTVSQHPDAGRSRLEQINQRLAGLDDHCPRRPR